VGWKRVTPSWQVRCDRLWEGFRESQTCSRDTNPESYITKYTSIRRILFYRFRTCLQDLHEGNKEEEEKRVRERHPEPTFCTSKERERERERESAREGGKEGEREKDRALYQELRRSRECGRDRDVR